MSVASLMKWTAGLLAAVVVAGTGFVVFKLRTMPLASLESCAEGAQLPGLSWACDQALHTVRPSAEDIREMNRSAGAIWIVDLKKNDAELARLLSRFVAAGLDMNATDQANGVGAGWTALHLAVGTPDVRGIRLLLAAGADPNVKDRLGRTPLALLRERAAQFPGDPRSAEAEQVLMSTQQRPARTGTTTAPGS